MSLHVDHPLSALQPGECIGFISRPVRSLAVVADPITACDTVLTVFLVSYNCILGISSPAKHTINIPLTNVYINKKKLKLRRRHYLQAADTSYNIKVKLVSYVQHVFN